MNVTEQSWKTFGEVLTSWHGVPGGDWLSEAWEEELHLGTIAAQLENWGLVHELVNDPRQAVSRKAPFFILLKDKGEIGLALPPNRKTREKNWRLISCDENAEPASFSTPGQLLSALKKLGWKGEAIITNKADSHPEKKERNANGSSSHWFWSALWKHRGDFLSIIPLSFLINLFALAMPLFIMNVYDRVVPNDAVSTLRVLTIGVAIVFVFEFVLRILRGSFADAAGKGADQILSRTVFRHVVDMELSSRPASAGNLAGQARGYESVRDFLSSLTLIGLIDFPFALMMFAIVFWIGGTMGWIPLAASGVVLLFLLFLQPFLARFSGAAHRDRLHRQSLLTETANSIESIKAVNAGFGIQNRMASLVEESSRTDLKLRRLTQLGGAFTVFCIHLTTIAVIVAGVWLISEKNLSMGGLIACVMIVSRGMAPLGQVSQLLLRLQSVTSALKGIDEVVQLEQETERKKLWPRLKCPEIRLNRVSFTYVDQPLEALAGISLRIRPGERVGIVGRAGSGKTTLLRLLNRQLLANSGLVLFDGIDAAQISPRCIRRTCGYLPQDGSLVFGSVRDNIALGASMPSDDQIIAAAKATGVLAWTNRHPHGLDMEVGERGVLLSGGQRQMVLLARIFFHDPNVFLLDEPTNSLDLSAERIFHRSIQSKIEAEDKQRTLVLATHKYSMLELVDRVILFEAGKILLDGPRDEVLAAMKQSQSKPDSK